MSTLLYQCTAGISGDMNLGAMIALGVNPDELETELRKLPYKGWSLRFEPDQRRGISGTRCEVILESKHDHDHHHSHDHSHDHGHSHDHHHRKFSEIRDAIEQSGLSAKAKADAVACFRALAVAEGTVHGIAPEEVHFHEVGAIDSIIDMVGAAICWDLLGVERIVCNSLEVGGGTVQCAHGRMPVPAPATTQLLKGKPFTSGATNKETTTPTGAALLVGKGAEFGGQIDGQQINAGIGIGQRDDPNLANAVYVSLIEEEDRSSGFEQDEVIEFAANIDDLSGEAVSFLCQQLFAAGALDVWQTAASFKKGRLGCIVHALAAPAESAAVEKAYFLHSSTLGVRRQRLQRSKLARKIQTLETQWGPVRVKQASGPNEIFRQKYEYEDLARIAKETDQPIQRVTAQLDQINSKS